MEGQGIIKAIKAFKKFPYIIKNLNSGGYYIM